MSKVNMSVNIDLEDLLEITKLGLNVKDTVRQGIKHEIERVKVELQQSQVKVNE